jgi:hypothetical protein
MHEGKTFQFEIPGLIFFCADYHKTVAEGELGDRAAPEVAPIG